MEVIVTIVSKLGESYNLFTGGFYQPTFVTGWTNPLILNTMDIPVLPRKLTWLAGKSTVNEDVFPIETGDFPMSC